MSDSITVLLVDEDRDILDITTTFLQREAERLDVETTTGTTAALERLEDSGDVDCIVSDYTMPEMTGVDFLEAVREREPGLPFFFFTGRDRADLEAELGTETFDGYIRKGTGTDQYADLAADILEAVEDNR